MIKQLNDYKYDNIDDLHELRSVLLSDPPPDANVDRLLVLVMSAKLMRSGLIANLIHKFTPLSFSTRFFMRIVEVARSHNASNGMFNSTLNHMVYGVDCSDPKSAGGWNEVEFSIFIHLIELSGFNPNQ